MKITWINSEEKQVERYIKSAQKVRSGFFQSNRFYLLPFMPQKFRDRVVFLPESKYLYRLSKSSSPTGNIENSEIEKIVSNISKKHNKQLTNLQNDFFNLTGKILPKIESKFPKSKSLNIIITPSLFGTIGEYSLGKKEINLKPRFDRNAKNIFQLLVTALTHYCHFGYNKNLDRNKQLWLKKQLLSASIQNELGIMSGSRNTVRILKNSFSGDLAEQSFNYYKKLGYPVKKGIANFTNLRLTRSEKKLLTLLSKNQNKVVDYDKISEAVWLESSDDKYSLQAISKLVQRLKDKLNKSGINSYLIHSQRGKGYILFD